MIEIISETSQLSIEKVIENLNSGNLVCFPTETVYALACKIDKNSISKIYSLKQRNINKPLSLLCSSIPQIQKIAEIDDLTLKIMKSFSPGPITYIVNIKPAYKEVFSKFSIDNTIGVRIPNHPFALKILSNLNYVIATSVNLAGGKSSTNIEDILKYFSNTNQINLIVDGGNSCLGIPSTVVKILNSEIKILREGFITLEQIKLVI